MVKVFGSTSLNLVVPEQYLKSENNQKNYLFNFEYIYDQSYTQKAIFNEMCQVIQSCLDGYNVCIFAYGQTGSGKTYSMIGNYEHYEQRGIFCRSIEFIFSQLEQLKQQGWEHSLFSKITEIYNDNVRCLITNEKTQKPKSIQIFSDKELIDLFVQSVKNRKVNETEMNEQSSRSHCIFQLEINGICKKDNQSVKGTLNLIDLAGSERLSMSMVEGETMKETQAINKSLTALCDVITALGRKEKHIPYRNSKLTQVLEEYLGGNSITLMLVNISPKISDYYSSLCSLRFAETVKSCKNHIFQKFWQHGKTPQKQSNKKSQVNNSSQQKQRLLQNK